MGSLLDSSNYHVAIKNPMSVAFMVEQMQSSNVTIKLGVLPVFNGWKILPMEALVLLEITVDPFECKWKLLACLPLADSDFRVSASIDILLGADVFSCTILHGQQFGPQVMPSAINTHFSWYWLVPSVTVALQMTNNRYTCVEIHLAFGQRYVWALTVSPYWFVACIRTCINMHKVHFSHIRCDQKHSGLTIKWQASHQAIRTKLYLYIQHLS